MLNQKRNLLIIFALLSLLFSGCNIQATPTFIPPAQDQIATQVAALLTATPQAPIPTEPPVVTATAPVPTATQPVPPTATATVAAPTETLAPTETPPTSTPTEVAGDPRLSLGDPTFIDDSFKENGNWGSDWKDEFTQGQFQDHQLVLTSIGVDGWTITWPKPSDFYMEMTAKTGECAGKDRYGLIIRVPETFDRGYLFGFTCDGQYSLRIWNPEEKKYEYLIDWTASSHIKAGSEQTNRLGIMAEGDRFSLYANGHFLAEASDDTYSKGTFGPFIGHAETPDFTIYISEIAYWELP